MSCAIALREHCLRGHAWTPENTRLIYVDGRLRQRLCRTCQQERTATLRSVDEPTTLDRAALRRLLDAHDDGVSTDDLRDRFGLSCAELIDALAEARRHADDGPQYGIPKTARAKIDAAIARPA